MFLSGVSRQTSHTSKMCARAWSSLHHRTLCSNPSKLFPFIMARRITIHRMFPRAWYSLGRHTKGQHRFLAWSDGHADSFGFNKRCYSTRQRNLTTPLFIKMAEFEGRMALIDQNGQHRYEDLLRLKDILADKLQQSGHKLQGKTVCFLCDNDASYIVAMLAIWTLGGIAVPLCKSHPRSELEYFIEDSQCSLLLGTHTFQETLQELANKKDVSLHMMEKSDCAVREGLLQTEDDGDGERYDPSYQNRQQQLVRNNAYKNLGALIIYTSGTTGRPKGALHTFGSLQAQMEDMVTAWEWTPADVILHVLPLHHIHGVVNVLMTPLHVGATCVMLPTFDVAQVWKYLLNSASPALPRGINMFMAVPTVYAKLLEGFEQRYNRGRRTKKAREYAKAVCSTKIRLMVSGSAALPQPIMAAWEELTGHKLLERYGMTELGMVLTNPLHGNRTPGCVGNPFPKVQVMLARQNSYVKNGYDKIAVGNHRWTQFTPGPKDEQGELMVRGPSVFQSYWNKPVATRESFTPDGWFKTGDTACYENGVYKILGRTSVDIIKSGGYKISALDIERHLLAHSDITDVAVVGLPDLTWGQRVAAVVVLRPGCDLILRELREWCGDKMPPYQHPTVLRVLEEMPRNAMGKVNKKELLASMFSKEMKSVY